MEKDYSSEYDFVIIRYLVAGTQEQLFEDKIPSSEDLNLAECAAKLLSKGYEIIESDLPADGRISVSKKKFYTVYIREKITIIFPHSPKTAGSAVEFSQDLVWPEGVTYSDLNITASRQVRYVYEDGTEAGAPVRNQIAFDRTAMVNHVTGQVNYMVWQPVEGIDSFASVPTPEIKGYAPDIQEVEGYQVRDWAADSVRSEIVVTYYKETQQAMVLVIDEDTNEVLFRDKIEGKTAEPVNYPVEDILHHYLVRGYELVNNDLAEALYFDNDTAVTQEFVVRVKAREVQIYADSAPEVGTPVYPEYADSVTWPIGVSQSNLEKVVTRTIITQYEDSSSAEEPVIQTVVFKRTAKLNLLSGEVIYSPWNTENDRFPAYTPAEKNGYLPKPRSVAEVAGVTVGTPSSREVIVYAKKIQKATVQFVDYSRSNEVLYQVQLVGKTGDNLRYNPQVKIQEFVNHGYEVVDNNFPENGVFDNVDRGEPVFTVGLTPRLVEVEPRHPKVAGSYIDEVSQTGPKWPAGVDTYDLRHEVSRTIHYKFEDGDTAHESSVETLVFERRAEVNLVSGQVVYSDWSNGHQGFPAREVPSIPGHYSDIDHVEALNNITVHSTNFELVIHYIRIRKTQSIKFVDISSQEVLREEEIYTTADGDLQKELEAKLLPYYNQGYILYSEKNLETALRSAEFQPVTIDLKQVELTVNPDEPKEAYERIDGYDRLTWPIGLKTGDLVKTITRRIQYRYDTGLDVREDDVQELVFKRHAKVNIVTGQVSYTDWKSADKEFASVLVPKLAGYRSNVDSIPSLLVHDDQLDQVVQVIYYSEPNMTVVEYVDTETGLVVLVDEVIGSINETVHYLPEHKLFQHGLGAYQVVGGDCPEVITIDEQVRNYRVEVKARYSQVTVSNPHLPNTLSTIEGYGTYRWPYGVDYNSLHRSVTRRIHYLNESNESLFDTVEHTIYFSREATVNLVTGQVTYTNWFTDGTSFPAVDSPYLEGYHADRSTVDAFEVTRFESSYTMDVNVIYRANPYRFHIYVKNDLTNETLEVLHLVVKSNDELYSNVEKLAADYQTQGYELLGTIPALDSDLDNHERDISILLVPKFATVTLENVTSGYATFEAELVQYLKKLKGLTSYDLSRTITRTINYLYPDGKPVAQPYKDSVIFKRQAKVNLVTGEVTYDNWSSYYTAFDQIVSPLIEDYTPSKEISDSVDSVKPDDVNILETITYTRNVQPVVVNVVANPQPIASRQSDTAQEVQTESTPVTDTKVSFDPLPTEDSAEPTSEVEELAPTAPVEDAVPELIEEVAPKELRLSLADTDLLDKHFITKSDLRKNFVRKIDYLFSDGKQAAESIEQKLSMVRHAIVQTETNFVEFTDWEPETDAAFEAVTSPVIEGYDADNEHVQSQQLDVNAESIVTEVVVYNPIIQNIEVKYSDRETGEELLSFKFSSFNKNDSDKRIEKVNLYFADRGYNTVSSSYPDNVELLADGSQYFEIVLTKEALTEEEIVAGQASVSEEVLASEAPTEAVESRESEMESVSQSETIATDSIEESAEESQATAQEPVSTSDDVATDAAKKGKEPKRAEKKKGFFGFLFKD